MKVKMKNLFLEIMQPAHMLLFGMLALSAFAVVFSSYQSRQLFHELQTLQHEVGTLQLEWRQLLVEEGAFSSHLRIEQKASEELGMHVPKASSTMAVNLQ